MKRPRVRRLLQETPWFVGAAVTLRAWPGERIVAPAALCSPGAHGVMTLYSFKSIEGDQ
jgi:hypothetical protein